MIEAIPDTQRTTLALSRRVKQGRSKMVNGREQHRYNKKEQLKMPVVQGVEAGDGEAAVPESRLTPCVLHPLFNVNIYTIKLQFALNILGAVNRCYDTLFSTLIQ